MKNGLISAIALIILSGFAYSQTPKNIMIGLVDVETIVKAIPEATEADKRLKELSKKYQDTLQLFQQDFETRISTYDKQRQMMPADQQKKEEESLKAFQMQILSYKEQKFGQSGELVKLQSEYLEPIRKKVKDAIESVAKEEKMNFVFDKSSSVLLYGDEVYDITYRVLDRIKRKK